MSSQQESRINYYKQLTVAELRDTARGLNIKGRSKMRKQKLIESIVEEIEKYDRTMSLQMPVLRRERTLFICRALLINDDLQLERCSNQSEHHHCPDHEQRYRLEKPDDCPVCMDSISCITETPLECGHWIHKHCLVPTNIHICPVCRQSMQIHEADYIFGRNHQQRNQYAQNYFIPFDVPVIPINNPIQQAFAGNIINFDVNVFNNQEHFAQMPFMHLFGEDQEEHDLHDEDYDNHIMNAGYFPADNEENNMPELVNVNEPSEEVQPGLNYNAFDNYMNNHIQLHQEENYEENDEDNYENEENGFVNPFINYTDDNIDMIVREIESRPRNNPFVTMRNNLTEIDNNMYNNFINSINDHIMRYCSRNHINFDNMFIYEVRSNFSYEDMNLARIIYNLLFIHIDINISMRLDELFRQRIESIVNMLTYSE